MPATAEYDALAGICGRRRSVREFAPTPVAADDVDRLIAAARTSPYASGRSNWEVQVVDDPAVIRAMAAAVRDRVALLSPTMRDDMRQSFTEYSANFTAFETAPLLLVPCFRTTAILSMMQSRPDADTARLERDSCVKSISCVAMLILLAAESLGLGACYMTGALIAEESIAKLLLVKPGRSIGAIIPVGYRPEGGGHG